MSDEDRVVADEAGGESSRSVARRLAVPAAARRAPDPGVRLVLQRRLEPDALVRPALPLGPAGRRRTSTTRSHAPGRDGYVRRQPQLRRGGARGARARPGRDRLLPRLPPLRRAAHRARGAARRDARALRRTSRGRSRTTGTSSRRDPAGGPRRAARERRRRLPHGALAAQLPARCEDIVGARPTSTAAPSSTAAARCRSAPTRSRSTRASSTSSRRARPCSRPRRRLESARPEQLVLRVDRTDPVEERRPRLARVRALPRPASGDARPRADARAARPVAAGHPRVRGVPRGDPARGAARERPVRACRLAADRPPHRATTSPQSVAAYKQYDVLLVNAVFDGLNLVAKEAPLVNTRDGVLVLSENAGAHEELGDWALTVNPFDVAGQADAIHRGARRWRRRSGAGGSRGSAHTCASTTSARGCDSCRSRRAARAATLGCLAVSGLSHVDDVRRGAHGRRRRQADVASARGRARRGADGARDGAAAARAAEGRRARDGAARRDHGGEADERAHPALPPAAAHARRRLARGRGRPRRDHGHGRDDRADRRRDGGADGRDGRRARPSTTWRRRSTRSMVDRRGAPGGEDEGQ